MARFHAAAGFPGIGVEGNVSKSYKSGVCYAGCLDTLAVSREPGRWLVVLNRLCVANIKQVVRRGRVLLYNENAIEKT